MGKQSASNFAVLLVDGYDMRGAQPKSFSSDIDNITQPTHGLGDEWATSVPVGMRSGQVSQDGAFFDTSTANIHEAMKDAPETTRIIAWATAGNAIGALFSACQGALSVAYGVLSRVAGLTEANVKYLVTGALEDGVIVQSHTTKTIDWNTKTDGASVDYTLDPSQTVIPITSATKDSPCVVTTTVPHGLTTGDLVLASDNTLSGPSINSEQAVTVLSATTYSVAVDTSGSSGAGTGGSFVRANSNNGGVGYQLVSALTVTGHVGKIRDSADDTTFADLVTFANVTAPPPDASASQRIAVSGVVDRYLCYDGDITGTGVVKPFVGFKRNSPA